jgi:hypothetical protein
MKIIMESVMKVGHESTVVQARESKCGKSYLEPDRKIDGLGVWVGGVIRRTRRRQNLTDPAPYWWKRSEKMTR